ncbi:tudor domain-containing protein [Candidatus Contubernalis alkaliaceticus]|uniref:tudor domain-containing protein n=1 Tax=Candidatus Contubernalis alkaliaceticus TaxID=338645 RepID=UPI001F4BCEFB|nr:hypothetical protein [Candidatus Contubernalis alkalaceticus]UNC91657.1 hypothetical protein HUE98_05860 [Candidatus Contubernalis alkalaceticus]
MFEVGERVLSRYGIWHRIKSILSNGHYYECERLDTGKTNIIHKNNLRKAREADERAENHG